MAAAVVNNSVTAVGKTFTTQRTVDSDGAVLKDPTLGAAKTGSLTTRTDANTGTLTMTAGHGITTGARLDVYWDGGVRYGMTVGSVVTNSVPIDGGAGDDLPTAATAITAMVPQLESFPVTTADMKFLGVSCSAPAVVVFLDDADAEVRAIPVDGSADAFTWDDDTEADNPFASDVVSAYFSHGASSGAKQVNALALVN